MAKRNRGVENEKIAILMNMYCYANSIEINGLGEYNNMPVYLPDGDEDDPNKKRILDSSGMSTYVKDKYNVSNIEDFKCLINDRSMMFTLCDIFNVSSANSNYKSDFYRGDLGLSVKNYSEDNTYWDLKRTDISILNRGYFNAYLTCANRIANDDRVKELYDEYGVLNEQYEEKIKSLYLEFILAIKEDKFPLNCRNYKITTKEKGFWYDDEKWKYIKPMIAYFCTMGTYFGDSFNTANCMLEIINPFDINTYSFYYDILNYIEYHRDKCNFEIRGVNEVTYKSIFSRIDDDVLLQLGMIRKYIKEDGEYKLKLFGLGRVGFYLPSQTEEKKSSKRKSSKK